MNLKNNLLTACLFFFVTSLCVTALQANAQNSTHMFYELKVYHFTNSSQEAVLDDYVGNAYIPALHKLGYNNIGAFKPIGNDTAADKKLYVLLPLKSLDETYEIEHSLDKDQSYKSKASDYLDAVYNNPPYDRIETILMRAFKDAPVLTKPELKSPKKERIYELRSYESATEKYYHRKLHMFNEGGEIPLFTRLNFNQIFFGDVISGSRMPNLMYMTSFENIADREAHWKDFVDSPEWKKLSSDPFYENAVIVNQQILTHPAEYSDF